jgi:tetratricopeptide (TPR) repeat protein
VTFLQQALSVTTAPGDRAELLERASESARIATRTDKAIDLARQAVEAHRSIDDPLGAARATIKVGQALLDARRDREAQESLEAGLSEYADLWPDPTIADLKTQLARAYLQLERNEDAIRLTNEALEVAEHGNHLGTVAVALTVRGAGFAALGRLREGLALIRGGEDVAREIGDTELILLAMVVRGYNLGEVDNAAAAQLYKDGLALARRVGHRLLTLQFINNFGYTGFLTGEWDAALAEMEGALAGDLDSASRVWILSNDLIIPVSRGEAVDDRMAELDALAEQHTDPNIHAAPNDTRANLAQAEGRLADAERLWISFVDVVSTQAPAAYYQASRPALWAGNLDALKKYLSGLDATGYHGPVVEARRTNLRAAIAALEGRQREAKALYLEALAGWRDLKVTWEEALTGIDMATVLDLADPDVQAVIRSTREILTRLGAKPYLERLEQAAARGSVAPVRPGRPVDATVAEPA